MASGRRALVIVVMVVVAVALEAAWLAPATLLGPPVARATGGILQLCDSEGTVWRGRATAAVGTARIPVTWRVEIWPLWRGEARFRLAPPAGGARLPRATIALTGQTVAFDDVDVTLPADAFAAALRKAAVGSLGGDINVNAATLYLAPDSSRGEVRFGWRGARLTFIGSALPLDLGDVRATLVADGRGFSGPVDNAGGDLGLRGQWTLRPAEGLHLALQLTPRRPGQTQLQRALSALGTPDGTGWRIDWKVPLR
jgi:hypothetical protein